MSDRFIESRWVEDFQNDGAHWLPAGIYDDSAFITDWDSIPGSFFLPYNTIAKLIPLLEERRLLLPRLDERLRVEDLKITHRLIDLLDKVANK